MIWRVLVFFGVLSTAAFVRRAFGDDAGSAVFSSLTALMLILSEIERRLAKILKELRP